MVVYEDEDLFVDPYPIIADSLAIDIDIDQDMES